MEKEVIVLRINKDLRDKIQAYARNTDRTVSRIVARALSDSANFDKTRVVRLAGERAALSVYIDRQIYNDLKAQAQELHIPTTRMIETMLIRYAEKKKIIKPIWRTAHAKYKGAS